MKIGHEQMTFISEEFCFGMAPAIITMIYVLNEIINVLVGGVLNMIKVKAGN